MQSFLVSQPVINFFRYALFFALLILHSHFVFSEVVSGGAPNPTCPVSAGTSCLHPSTASTWMQNCASNPGYAPTPATAICSPGLFAMQCSKVSSCTCPASYEFQVQGSEGSAQGACVPAVCSDGKPKVNGQCPVCIFGKNEDGTCKEDDSSSSGAASSGATSSTPTSSPDSGSSGSAASAGGDDGNPDNPDTGGGGNNTGGGSNGGSAAASSTPSGSNSSWTPNSGYGNWIPVDEGSNCPNKYRDAQGQWWCAGGDSDSSQGAGDCDPTSKDYWSCINQTTTSAGSAASASSGAASSSFSGGGDCEDEPQCPAGDIQCAQLLQQWHTRCGGDALDSKFFELEDQGDDKVTFSKSLANFKTELEKLPNTQIMTEFFEFNGSGGCPVWQVSAWVFDVVIDQQCSPDIPWGIISGIIIAIASLCAARIALT